MISNLPYLNYDSEFPFILVMVCVFSSISLKHFSLNSARVENEREREREGRYSVVSESLSRW